MRRTRFSQSCAIPPGVACLQRVQGKPAGFRQCWNGGPPLWSAPPATPSVSLDDRTLTARLSQAVFIQCKHSHRSHRNPWHRSRDVVPPRSVAESPPVWLEPEAPTAQVSQCPGTGTPPSQSQQSHGHDLDSRSSTSQKCVHT